MQAAASSPSAPTLSTYISLISVFLFLVFIVYSLYRSHKRINESGSLEKHLGGALAASQLPAAAVLTYAAFDPSVLAHLSGINVGLAVAGVVLGWVAIK